MQNTGTLAIHGGEDVRGGATAARSDAVRRAAPWSSRTTKRLFSTKSSTSSTKPSAATFASFLAPMLWRTASPQPRSLGLSRLDLDGLTETEMDGKRFRGPLRASSCRQPCGPLASRRYVSQVLESSHC